MADSLGRQSEVDERFNAPPSPFDQPSSGSAGGTVAGSLGRQSEVDERFNDPRPLLISHCFVVAEARWPIASDVSPRLTNDSMTPVPF